MPAAESNYSVTEFKSCGLAINIASFAPIVKGRLWHYRSSAV